MQYNFVQSLCTYIISTIIFVPGPIVLFWRGEISGAPKFSYPGDYVPSSVLHAKLLGYCNFFCQLMEKNTKRFLLSHFFLNHFFFVIIFVIFIYLLLSHCYSCWVWCFQSQTRANNSCYPTLQASGHLVTLFSNTASTRSTVIDRYYIQDVGLEYIINRLSTGCSLYLTQTNLISRARHQPFQFQTSLLYSSLYLYHNSPTVSKRGVTT